MNPTQVLSLAAALSLGFAAGAGFIALPQAPQESGDAAVELAPDEDELMAAWTAAGTPGEYHRLLQPFIGTWDAKAVMTMGEEADESGSTLVNRMRYDGRFLEQVYAGEFGGEPFEGFALWGYSNVDETYKAVWVDSTSTNISYAAGWASGDGKKFTMIGADRDPLSGELVEFEDVLTIEDADHYSIVRMETRGGEQAKAFEIQHTRQP